MSYNCIARLDVQVITQISRSYVVNPGLTRKYFNLDLGISECLQENPRGYELLLRREVTQGSKSYLVCQLRG